MAKKKGAGGSKRALKIAKFGTRKLSKVNAKRHPKFHARRSGRK